MDGALPDGSAGVIAIDEHDDAEAVAGALGNNIRSSIAQIDKASASELKAGLEEASAGLCGLRSMSFRDNDRGFVVVTGTSTGIGAATARHLAEEGFHVFAGVRRKVDGETLRARSPGRVTPLDPRRDGRRRRLRQQRTGCRSRGHTRSGRSRQQRGHRRAGADRVPADGRLPEQLEVNLFGPVAMIQASCP